MTAISGRTSRRFNDNVLLVFFIFLVAQIVCWNTFKHVRPDFIIVPEPPSKRSTMAFSLGDDQFYFRKLAFTLQNAGDTFGRFTALKDYDYSKLQQWFFLADMLDPVSSTVPVMAGYYYSQTQFAPDTRYVVDYLVLHAERDPAHKWWWLAQASHLANYRLDDKPLAADIAEKITAIPYADNPDIPLWARQLPAFIYEKTGEFEESLRIIDMVNQDLESSGRQLSDGELNFLRHFVINRIERPKAAFIEKYGADFQDLSSDQEHIP